MVCNEKRVFQKIRNFYTIVIMLKIILSLYVQSKNENQIKEELILQGFKKSKINKEFKKFVKKFNSVKEIF